MVRVKSRCWRCGEVTLSMEDIILVEHGDGDGVFYTFQCSSCGEFQAYPADSRFVDFMKMNAVEPVLLEAPIEFKEAEENAPLSWDDLLDLHLQLQQES
jgi:rRNA maturation protein Nop10